MQCHSFDKQQIEHVFYAELEDDDVKFVLILPSKSIEVFVSTFSNLRLLVAVVSIIASCRSPGRADSDYRSKQNSKKSEEIAHLSLFQPFFDDAGRLVLRDLPMTAFAARFTYERINLAEGKPTTRGFSDEWRRYFKDQTAVPLAPVAESNGEVDIEPGFIVRDPSNPSHYIIAIHGSRSVGGWITNSDAATIFIDDMPIHSGFAAKALRMWPKMLEQIGEQMSRSGQNPADCQLTFTGHSQGGAMATIFAAIAKKEKDFQAENQVRLYAISPAVAFLNEESVTLVNRALGTRAMISQRSDLDLVPKLNGFAIPQTIRKIVTLGTPIIPGTVVTSRTVSDIWQAGGIKEAIGAVHIGDIAPMSMSAATAMRALQRKSTRVLVPPQSNDDLGRPRMIARRR